MDNNCENIRLLDRFPYNNNYDIVIGEDGTAFVLSSAGIFVVDEEDLLADGEDTIEYKLFDAVRGFKKSLTPNAWNYIDEDDNLYLSTDTGVVYMNLNNYDAFSGVYRMTIESIIVDGVEQKVEHGQEVHIARDAEKLEIVPLIINYTINTPYISVYLEGFDDEPQIMLQNEMTDSVYANLPVGTYTYHIAVLDSKGHSVVSECSITIIKDREIYDNWWFYAYVIALFAAAVAYLTWLFFRTQIERTINMQKKELQLARDQIEMGNETVLTIARTVDAKDENTSQHTFRVSEYSVMIAKKLGFSEEECENLRKTALLHDIGKIGIPDRVLNKPGKLTDEEYAMMKSHVVKGSEILSTFKLIDNVADGALYHHERYDGTGYVHGLKGEEIPLNARIIGIADAFDAMTANRVYRKRLDIDYVIGELHRGRGTQFDPKLVDIMLELIESREIDVERIYAEDGANVNDKDSSVEK
jgi:energy-coupling factor transport system substrate-specific component